ncbi:hypothetical protein AB4171_16760, partial [Vibrio sp. 10N.286.51.A4]
LLLITAQNSEALEKLSKNHKLNIKIKFIRHLKFHIFYNSGSLQLRMHLKVFKKHTNHCLSYPI